MGEKAARRRFTRGFKLEAVRQVKDELGPEALILSQRTKRPQGGLFGLLGRSVVEVTAAVDRDVRRAAAPREERAEPDPSWREFQLARALVAPLESELRAMRSALAAETGGAAGAEELAREVARLRRETSELRTRRRGCLHNASRAR